MLKMLRRHIRTLAKQVVPHRVVFLVRRYAPGTADLRKAERRARYRDHSDVPKREGRTVAEAYSDFLGGGAEEWEPRARAQVAAAVELGLEPHHRMLEIGCGPGRATPYFAEVVGEGELVAFDQRPDFVDAARDALRERGVDDSRSRFEVVQDFEMRGLGRFDFAIAWSVLNHCTWGERADFFERFVDHLSVGGRLVVSGAAWMRTPFFLDWLEDVIAARGLTVVRRVESVDDLESVDLLPETLPIWVFERR